MWQPLPPRLGGRALTFSAASWRRAEAVKVAAVLPAPLIGTAARLAVRAFPARLLPAIVKQPGFARFAPWVVLLLAAYSACVTYFAFLQRQQRASGDGGAAASGGAEGARLAWAAEFRSIQPRMTEALGFLTEK